MVYILYSTVFNVSFKRKHFKLFLVFMSFIRYFMKSNYTMCTYISKEKKKENRKNPFI